MTTPKNNPKNPKSAIFVQQPSRTNVSLNFMNRSYDEFEAYADTYHRAAQDLFEKNFKPHTRCDLDVLPIGFLYRHALELYLKAIARRGNSLLSLRNMPQVPMRQVHSLVLLADDIKPIFEFMEWSWDAEREGFRSFGDFRKALSDLEHDKVLGIDDRQGDMWRYPVRKKDDEPHLPVHFNFDVREYVSRLDFLVRVFSGAAMSLDWALDAAYEAASYEQDAIEQMYDAMHDFEPDWYEPEPYEPNYE
jgi:hypothetical protein